MQHRKPSVTLIEHTQDPDLVLYVLWKASRTDDEVHSVSWYREMRETAMLEEKTVKEIDDIFYTIVAANIPVAESVRFTFLFQNITVAWREQLVRHRTNSYWSQSSRARPLGEFFEKHVYWTPEEIADNPLAVTLWDQCMRAVGETYRALEHMGISRENARGVLPQYMVHRISMTITLRHLVELVKARTCWIAQSDLWHPMICGMLSEIREKVDSRLANILGSPPCAAGAEYRWCPIGPDNGCRLRGEDPEPPCPLWLAQIGHHGDFYKRDRAIDLMHRFDRVWHADLVQIAHRNIGE